MSPAKRKKRPCLPKTKDIAVKKVEKPILDQQMKNDSQKKEKKEVEWNFFCDACDRFYTHHHQLSNHFRIHKQCGLGGGCKFEASPQEIKFHKKMQHDTGYASAIWQLNSPEEVEIWKQERNTNFPRSQNYVEQRTVQVENVQQLKQTEQLEEAEPFESLENDKNTVLVQVCKNSDDVTEVEQADLDEDTELVKETENDAEDVWNAEQVKKMKQADLNADDGNDEQINDTRQADLIANTDNADLHADTDLADLHADIDLADLHAEQVKKVESTVLVENIKNTADSEQVEQVISMRQADAVTDTKIISQLSLQVKEVLKDFIVDSKEQDDLLLDTEKTEQVKAEKQFGLVPDIDSIGQVREVDKLKLIGDIRHTDQVKVEPDELVDDTVYNEEITKQGQAARVEGSDMPSGWLVLSETAEPNVTQISSPGKTEVVTVSKHEEQINSPHECEIVTDGEHEEEITSPEQCASDDEQVSRVADQTYQISSPEQASVATDEVDAEEQSWLVLSDALEHPENDEHAEPIQNLKVVEQVESKQTDFGGCAMNTEQVKELQQSLVEDSEDDLPSDWLVLSETAEPTGTQIEVVTDSEHEEHITSPEQYEAVTDDEEMSRPADQTDQISSPEHAWLDECEVLTGGEHEETITSPEQWEAVTDDEQVSRPADQTEQISSPGQAWLDECEVVTDGEHEEQITSPEQWEAVTDDEQVSRPADQTDQISSPEHTWLATNNDRDDEVDAEEQTWLVSSNAASLSKLLPSQVSEAECGTDAKKSKQEDQHMPLLNLRSSVKRKMDEVETDVDPEKEAWAALTANVLSVASSAAVSNLLSNQKFLCEACDTGFFDNICLWKKHCSRHIVCGRDGCKFTAIEIILKLHVEWVHKTGYAHKIIHLNTPEEVEKWKTERKKRFPRAEQPERTLSATRIVGEPNNILGIGSVTSTCPSNQQSTSNKLDEHYFCDACERVYYPREHMNAHLSRHITCGLDGCMFSALKQVLQDHRKMVHEAGCFIPAVWCLTTPGAISIWIRERKKHFPRSGNNVKQQAEQVLPVQIVSEVKSERDVEAFEWDSITSNVLGIVKSTSLSNIFSNKKTVLKQPCITQGLKIRSPQPIHCQHYDKAIVQQFHQDTKDVAVLGKVDSVPEKELPGTEMSHDHAAPSQDFSGTLQGIPRPANFFASPPQGFPHQHQGPTLWRPSQPEDFNKLPEGIEGQSLGPPGSLCGVLVPPQGPPGQHCGAPAPFQGPPRMQHSASTSFLGQDHFPPESSQNFMRPPQGPRGYFLPPGISFRPPGANHAPLHQTPPQHLQRHPGYPHRACEPQFCPPVPLSVSHGPPVSLQVPQCLPVPQYGPPITQQGQPITLHGPRGPEYFTPGPQHHMPSELHGTTPTTHYVPAAPQYCPPKLQYCPPQQHQTGLVPDQQQAPSVSSHFPSPSLIPLPITSNFHQNEKKPSEVETEKSKDTVTQLTTTKITRKGKRRERASLWFAKLKKEAKVKLFHCDACDWAFKTQIELDKHLHTHITCGLDDCQFEAYPLIVAIHKPLVHGASYSCKIWQLNSSEAITKWKEERKKGYPRSPSTATPAYPSEKDGQMSGAELDRTNSTRFLIPHAEKESIPPEQPQPISSTELSSDNTIISSIPLPNSPSVLPETHYTEQAVLLSGAELDRTNSTRFLIPHAEIESIPPEQAQPISSTELSSDNKIISSIPLPNSPSVLPETHCTEQAVLLSGEQLGSVNSTELSIRLHNSPNVLPEHIHKGQAQQTQQLESIVGTESTRDNSKSFMIPQFNEGEDYWKFFCDACNCCFTHKVQLIKHINRHVTCGRDGCRYEGQPFSIQIHTEVVHEGGYVPKVWHLNTPEEIEKWKIERKQNFPTMQKVSKLLMEKEVLQIVSSKQVPALPPTLPVTKVSVRPVSVWKSMIRQTEKIKKFYCDACETSFFDKYQFEKHCNQHVNCDLFSCTYAGDKVAVGLHVQWQHATGYARKIYRKNSLEEIKKWRMDRKKNFPLPEGVTRVQDVNMPAEDFKDTKCDHSLKETGKGHENYADKILSSAITNASVFQDEANFATDNSSHGAIRLEKMESSHQKASKELSSTSNKQSIASQNIRDVNISRNNETCSKPATDCKESKTLTNSKETNESKGCSTAKIAKETESKEVSKSMDTIKAMESKIVKETDKFEETSLPKEFDKSKESRECKKIDKNDSKKRSSSPKEDMCGKRKKDLPDHLHKKLSSARHRSSRSPSRRKHHLLHRNLSPLRHSPLRGSRSPLRGSRSPLRGSRSPLRGSRSSLRGSRSPLRGSRSPLRGSRSPLHGHRSPMRGRRSPLRVSRSPLRGSRSPLRRSCSPLRRSHSRRSPLRQSSRRKLTGEASKSKHNTSFKTAPCATTTADSNLSIDLSQERSTLFNENIAGGRGIVGDQGVASALLNIGCQGSDLSKASHPVMDMMSHVITLQLLKQARGSDSSQVQAMKEQIFAELVKEEFGENVAQELRKDLESSFANPKPHREVLPLNRTAVLQSHHPEGFSPRSTVATGESHVKQNTLFSKLLSSVDSRHKGQILQQLAFNRAAASQDKKEKSPVQQKIIHPSYLDLPDCNIRTKDDNDTISFCSNPNTGVKQQFICDSVTQSQGSVSQSQFLKTEVHSQSDKLPAIDSRTKGDNRMHTLDSDQKIQIAQQLASILSVTGRSEVSDELLARLVQQAVKAKSNVTSLPETRHSKHVTPAFSVKENSLQKPYPAHSVNTRGIDFGPKGSLQQPSSTAHFVQNTNVRQERLFYPFTSTESNVPIPCLSLGQDSTSVVQQSPTLSADYQQSLPDLPMNSSKDTQPVTSIRINPIKTVLSTRPVDYEDVVSKSDASYYY